MLIGQARHDAPTRSTRDKAKLQQIRFVDILDGLRVLAGAGSQSIETDGTAVKFLNDRQQQVAVGCVQPDSVDFQPVERLLCYFPCNHAIGPYLRIVAHALEQAVDNTRRPARATGDLIDAIGFGRHLENLSRADQNLAQGIIVVVFHAIDSPEAVAQGSCQRANARRCAYYRKRWQREAQGARAWPFADHHIQGEILHRRIQPLLYSAGQTVNLIDKQDFAGLQRGQNRGQVAGVLNSRARSCFQTHTHLGGNDIAERCLAQARRTVEQNMIDGLAALERGLQQNIKIFFNLLLSNIFGQAARAKASLDGLFFFTHLWGDETVGHIVLLLLPLKRVFHAVCLFIISKFDRQVESSGIQRPFLFTESREGNYLFSFWRKE